MADYESSIRIDIDSAAALAAIKSLQKQISAFHSSIAKGSSSASVATANLQKDLVNNINATGQFAASMTGIRTTTESFTNALEKNKLSMGEYFRFAGGASKKFGKSFGREFDIINKVARERVKDLQTQYIQMGRDANGAMQAIKVRPLTLDMNDLGTKTQIAAQRQQLFNQLLKQGSTNLLNFGKNTQWAGRQLMVGFTIPLSIMATAASREFMKIERQAIRFRRVYGDAFSTPEGTEEALKNVKELASEFTKYGVELEKTMELAADAAQMGLSGAALSAQITQATRLSVLGEVSQQEALKTTVSVMNAFGIAAGDLASKIDFLNAVENETMTAISDLTIAIPKAAPVVRQLGGSVEDLAFFLTAMKEGGINASEGANALKSGLASLINPTKQSSEMLKSFGINVTSIVEANKGDVKGLVLDFAMALDELDPLNRARAIEQLFGKFQFSRISTLFQNVITEGSQASRVLELTGSSAAELAKISERELGNVAQSSMFKFQKAVEDLKIAIAPIGEQFLKAVTPLIEFGTKILTQFNNMGDGVKNFVVIGGAILAGLGPIFLMTFGLIANGVANIIKGFAAVRGVFLKTKDSSNILGEQLSYMSTEQIEAAAVASSLERAHYQLEQRFTSEALAVNALVAAYERGIKAQGAFSGLPRVASAQAQTGGVAGYNSGVVSVPGPRGAGDIVPAMLSPGEAVIPAKAAQKYAPIIKGMIAGNLPGFNKGVMLGMPRSGKSTGKNRDAAEEIYQMFLQSSYANVAPTNYGHQLSPTSGHSFPIFGLGGVYMGPGGEKVFVKPVMDEKAALAEMRGTQIARQVHGLKAPEQRIVVINDPQDPKRQRRFLALESKLDSTFVNNDPMALFNEEQYFKQLVASLLRVDKDLSAGNVFGDVVADVGPAGVFNRASGIRDYQPDLPSMEDQAMINLLGIKGGAKRAFAESTLGLMSGLTPEQYHQRMIQEIQQVLPLLKQTVAGFGLTDPAEATAYNDMIRRLEQGLTTDWSKFHAIHSAVKIAKPKQSTVPGFNKGVVSVPGPKGKGDIVPAMLTPGEAVIPADKAQKYASLINAMIAGNIPGYEKGLSVGAVAAQLRQPGGRATEKTVNASHVAGAEAHNLAKTLLAIAAIDEEFGETEVSVTELVPVMDKFGKQVTKVVETVDDATGEVKQSVKLMFDDIKSSIKVKDLDPSKQMMVQGLAFGGTAIPESQKRNKDAYQAAGIESASFTLGQASDAGAKAAAALASRNDLADDVVRELQLLVEEGKQARKLLELEGSATADLTYSKSVAASAIEFAINQDTQSGLSASEAKAEAELRTSKVLQQYEKDIADGITQEEALEKARLRLQKAMVTASENLAFTSFDEGGSRDLGRPYNTKGGKGIKSGSKGQLVDRGKNKVSRGRDSATAVARMGMVGAETEDDIFLNIALASKPSAAALSAAAEAGRTGSLAINKEVTSAIKRGIGSNSPSKEFENISNAVSSGVRQGGDDAAAAGAEVSRRISQSVIAQSPKVYTLPGLRRVTTDVNLYEQHMKDFSEKQAKIIGNIIRQHDSLAQGLKSYFGKIKTIGPAFDVNTREATPAGDKAQPGGFQALNSQLMTLSFAFSSISSVAGIFGTEMGFLNEMMFGMSNAMFALTGITQLMVIAKGEELKEIIKSIVATKVKTLAFIKNTFATNANTGAKLFDGGFVAGFKKLGTSLATTFPALGKFGGALLSLGQGLLRLLPVIGIASAAFITFKVIADTLEKQKQKIEGMGNAAALAGDKLASFAAMAGFQPTRDPGQRFEESQVQAVSGASAEEAVGAVAIRDTEEFKSAIKEGGSLFQDLENLKTASLEDAQIAMQTLIVKAIALAPENADQSAIRATVAALVAESGRTGLSLDLPVTLDPFQPGNEAAVIDYVAGLGDKMAPLLLPDDNVVARFFANIANGLPPLADATEFVSEDRAADARILGSGTTAGLEQLNTQLAAGKIELKDYNDSVAILMGGISSLDNATGLLAAEQMLINFGVPKEDFDEIKDLESRLILINALSAGAPIQERDARKLELASGSDDPQLNEDAEEVRTRLLKETEDQLVKNADAVKKLQDAENSRQATLDLSAIETQIDQNKTVLENSPKLVAAGLTEAEALDALTDSTWANIFAQAQLQDIQAGGGTKFLDEAVSAYDALKASTEDLTGAQERAAGSTAIEEHRNKLQEQNSVLAWLTTNGMSVSDALTVIGDSTLLAGAKAKMSTEDYEDFVKIFTDIQKLSANLTVRSSGTAEQTPLQKAIEQLTGQRDEILQTNIAFKKLTKAGFSAAKAFDLSQDPILAAAIATTKVGSAGWERLVKALKATNKEIEKKAIQDLIKGKVFEVTNLEKQASVSAALEKLGYSYEQIQDIISDETALNMLSKDLEDGKLNAKDTLSYLTNIKKIANNEILLNLTTKEGAANEFEKLYDKAVGFLQEQKTELEIKFKFKTAEDEAIVNAAQDQIAGINFKIDDYEADLFRIEEQEEEINKEYEKRVEALDEVSKFNDKIARQQKSQLSIAGALASGDIAAAAAAIQQLNTEKAQEAIEERKKRLEESKERSLAALTGNSGKTRLELETAIKDLKKEIFDIEEDILEPANDRIRLIEIEKRDSLSSLDAQILKWDDLQNKVNLAKLKLTTKEMEAMEYQAKLIKDLLDNWDNIEDKEKTLTIIKKTLESGVASGTTGNNVVPPPTTVKPPTNNPPSGSPTSTTPTTGPGSNNIAPITPAELERIVIVPPPSSGGGGGGGMRFLSSGGSVFGAGTATSDSIPAMLSNGEYVIKASSVSKLGLDFLDFVNRNGQIPGFKGGGLIIPDRPTKKPPTAKPAVSKSKPNLRSALASDKKLTSSIIAAKPPTEKQQRDALFKGGGFQGFEAGFQGMMADIGKNSVVQSIGKAYSADNFGGQLFRATVATLSVPAETMGALAKKYINVYGQVSSGDILGAVKTVATGSTAVLEGVSNAFSGVRNASDQKPSMFEQAAQSAVDKNFFGAKTDPEMAALARIIGGSLNLAGDPLTYLGVGLATKGAKVATASGKAGRSTAATPGSVKMGDIEVPTFSVGKNKSVAFEGPEQDFSELSKLGINVVKTTPQGLLSSALSKNPASLRNLRLKSMIKNFDSNKIGSRELKLLDNMQASTVFDDFLTPRISGLATVASSLSGSRAATRLLDAKRKDLFNIVDKNYMDRRSTPYGGFQGEADQAIDPSKVSAIHSTKYPITRDADGNIVLKPMGNYHPDYARGSLHFTLEDTVKSHMYGQWDNLQKKIVTPLSSMIDKNGLPYNINSTDTWWMRNPGEDLKLAKSSVVSPYSNVDEYAAELIKRDLLKPGKMPPLMAVDDAANEVLHLVKDSYTPVDRMQIAKLKGLPPGISKIKAGTETGALEQLALKAAKKQIGTDTIERRLEQWSLNDAQFERMLTKFANENKLGVGNHMGSPVHMLEGSLMGMYSKTAGQPIFANLDEIDSIEALRFGALKGYFRDPGKDMAVSEGPEFAKGGLVRGAPSPSYMATGGVVKPKYMANGGIARALGSDTIPAMLTPGEFVMRKSAVDRIGAASLARMNAGGSPFASRQVMPSRGSFSSMVMPQTSIPRINFRASQSNGKPVIPGRGSLGSMAMPRLSAPKMKEQVFDIGPSAGSKISVPVNNSNVQQTTTKNLSSVYNYNLSVNVKSDANPDQIAKTVMGQIRQINSQGIRSNRF